MRVFHRLIAASVVTAVTGLFLVIVPSTPASAQSSLHTMSAGVTTVTEGQLATVTISLNQTQFLGQTISATVTTVDNTARSGNTPPDYVPKSETVTFTCEGFNCPTTKSFTVQTNDDSTREPTESVSIVLSNVQGANKGSDGAVNINDNEGGSVPTFAIIDPAPAAEGNTDNTRTVQVQLSAPSNQTVTLNYATADDTATANSAKGTPDYVPQTTQTLTWPAGTNDTKSINVTVKGDTFGEPDEKFAVNFGSPNNAALPDNQAFVQINNDDAAPPSISLAPAEPKDEGNAGTSDMIITINISQPAPQTLTVDYATADGTAVLKDDYTETKGTLTIGQGQTTKTVAVPIVGEQLAEPDETFTFTLSRPTNATLGNPSSQAYTIKNDDFGQITTAPGSGRLADIRTFGPAGAAIGSFNAYPTPAGGQAFTGGAHVARGDFLKADGTPGADGTDEFVTGTGRISRPLVRVLGPDGSIKASNLVYDQNFQGGVSVAAGNLDGDPANGDELVVAAGSGGGPHVRVMRLTGSAPFTYSDISNGGFMAYDPRFGGGLRLAVGDITGDLKDEIIMAPASGGGPHVRIFSLNAQGNTKVEHELMAYHPAFTGGVWVAAAGKKLFTGAGRGGGPHVRIFSNGAAVDAGGFMAYAPDFTGGVSVAAGNLDGDQDPEIATGPGPGGGPHVRVFEQNGAIPFGPGFLAYDDGQFTGGVEVAIGNG
ncbi:MAG TPA: Calx-beta domain-containing protein [Acidimicrobiales bacterium]|nr:Calx-beta domain-containing protein [Acidimicrobiales bacterium]